MDARGGGDAWPAFRVHQVALADWVLEPTCVPHMTTSICSLCGMGSGWPNLQLQHPSGCNSCCSQPQWPVLSRGPKKEKGWWYHSSSTTTCPFLPPQLFCWWWCSTLYFFLNVAVFSYFLLIHSLTRKMECILCCKHFSITIIWGKLCYF